jgi:hypothetical protein
MQKTKRQRIYAPEQLAYRTAKERYDDLLAQAGTILNAILDECGDLETDEEIEAYCEREAQVHTELGTLKASIALKDAEQALLDWGIAQAVRHPQVSFLDQITLQQIAQTPLLKYRKMAIDLIMRLEVPPTGNEV